MNGLSDVKADKEVGGVIGWELVSLDLVPVNTDIMFVWFRCKLHDQMWVIYIIHNTDKRKLIMSLFNFQYDQINPNWNLRLPYNYQHKLLNYHYVC